jgi:ABC-type sugar transport system ATPase subunit
LRQAHRREPLTTIYVTHDQDEALALADRLVVLYAGKIEHIGTPAQVYERPANRFVAGFVGSPRMNLIDGKLALRGEKLWFERDDLCIDVGNAAFAGLMPFIGRPVTLGLRPRELALSPAVRPAGSAPPIELMVKDVEYGGDRWLIRGATKSGAVLVASLDGSPGVLAGDAIHLCAQTDRANFFATDGEGRNLLVG